MAVGQDSEKELAIESICERILNGQAAVYGMIDGAGLFNSKGSRHGMRLYQDNHRESRADVTSFPEPAFLPDRNPVWCPWSLESEFVFAGCCCAAPDITLLLTLTRSQVMANSADRAGRIDMQAVRIETIIGDNGEVRLTQLPFKAGEEVEVIVLPRGMRRTSPDRFPLRGVGIDYERPTDPVAEEDWSALR